MWVCPIIVIIAIVFTLPPEDVPSLGGSISAHLTYKGLFKFFFLLKYL